MASIVFDQVCKSFSSARQPALRDVSVHINEGEFFVIVGPSGCGKSTTLRCIAGLEKPTSGEVIIDGRSMRHVPPSHRQVAMVFQEHSLYPHLSVKENLTFALRMRRVDRGDSEKRVSTIADMLEIASHLKAKPGMLSGGERQRVALGKALVQLPDARCLLFDEPLASLDARLRASLRADIKRLHRTLKFTAVYVTHDQDEAMTLADRMAVMNRGVVEHVGTPLDVYRAPANLFVAGFIGSPAMNFMHGTLTNASGQLQFNEEGQRGVCIALPSTSAALAEDARCTLGIRPHDLNIRHGSTPSDGANSFRAKIALVESFGGHCNVHFETAAGSQIIACCADHEELREGAIAGLSVNGGRVHIFNTNGCRVNAAPQAAS